MKVDSDLKSMSYGDEHSDGEEDGDFQSEDVSSNGFHTKADMRKSNKPIMEKRRRARINNCLNDLKGILLEAMRKDPARHSKLEKADILELTVRHLQNIQRNQLAIAMATDPTVLHRFKNGFSECATEVSRYLGRLESVDHGVKHRLTGHLGACVNGLQQVGPVASFGSSPRYSPLGGGMNFPPSHNIPVIPLSPAAPNTIGIHSSAPPQTSVVIGNGTLTGTGLISPSQSQDLNNNNNINVSRTSLNQSFSSSSCSSSTVTSSSLLNTSLNSNSNSPNNNNNNDKSTSSSISNSTSTNRNVNFDLSHSHHHVNKTLHVNNNNSNNNANRMNNSAFTVMGTPPPSPPPNSTHDDSTDMEISVQNIGTEKGTNTTPLFNIGGRGHWKSQIPVGLPLDFSLSNNNSNVNSGCNKNESTSKNGNSSVKRERCCVDMIRLGKVEMPQKADADSSSANVGSNQRDSMWRPW